MFLKPSTRWQWWLVYVGVGLGVSALLEVVGWLGQLWVYHPPWMFYVVWIGAFGLSPATMALLLRKHSAFTLFLVGSAIAFVAEVLNVLFTGFGWTHLPPFPLIDRPFWRLVSLGIGGGFFILIVNGITSAIYRAVVKPNKDDDKFEGIEETYEQLGDLPMKKIPDPFEFVKRKINPEDAEAFCQQLNPDGKQLMLSIDGGGTKGYITLHVLAKLEQMTGKKCSDIFDFIAGTSTGALIAAGLAMGISAHKLLLIYRSKTPKVFDRSPILEAIASLFMPRIPEKIGERNLLNKGYVIVHNQLRWANQHKALWELARAVLVTDQEDLSLLGDVKKKLLITIKDIRRSETIFAVNAGPGRTAYERLPLAYAVMGSATAPVYFEPFRRWIDGGVGTYQNPCYQATVVATQVMRGEWSEYPYQPTDDEDKFSQDNVIHFSFGTGVEVNWMTDERIKKLRFWEWLFYVVKEGQEDGSDDQVRNTQLQFARGGQREGKVDFRRFQIVLDPDILCRDIEDGGIGLKLLSEGASREEVEREKNLIKKLEMDAHDLEQIRIMENIGKAWATALFSNADGKGPGITRQQYPYLDPFADDSDLHAFSVYWPPATPPGLVPSYLNTFKKKHPNIDIVPQGLLDYRNDRLMWLSDRDDGREGYITQQISKFTEHYKSPKEDRSI